MPQVIPLKNRDDIRLTTQAAFPPQDDYEFVKRVHDWWSNADQASANWLKTEKGEHGFALGHQWETEDYQKIKETGRYPLVINKTLPTLMVVSGYERTNRMRVRYLPVEQGDTERAENWSEVGRIVQEQGEIDFNKSDTFFDMLKGGRGFLHLRMCYAENPKGDIASARVPPWELRIDPTSTKYDQSDARYLIWSKDVSYEELLLLWPEKADEILEAQQQAIATEQDMPFSDRDSDYDSLISKYFDKITNKWQLMECWYWQIEKIADYVFFNPVQQEWMPIDKEALARLLYLNPQLQIEKQPRYERVYYQAFVVGPIILQNEKSYLDYKGFPFVPFLGIADEEEGRHVGMVTALKDPQIEVNKRRTQVLHIINQAAKSGWYGPKGAFVNREQWEQESALPGFIGEYDIAEGQPPPQPIQPPPIPAAFIQLEQMASIDIRDVSGVNVELMGLSQKDTPGIVTAQRQRQGMTILQTYFDNLRRSTKILGRLMLSMMQQFYTDGRQYSIPGKQPVQLGEDYKVGRYDLIAEEAPWSPNQKMETALKLENILGIALKAGIPIHPDVLDYLDLPEAFTEKWKQLILQAMQSAGPDPLEQQEKQADIQKTQAETGLKKAQAVGQIVNMMRGPQQPQSKSKGA